MPQMQALCAQRFGSRNIARNDKFPATDREAKLLQILGRAKIADDEPAKPAAVVVKALTGRKPRKPRNPNQPKRTYRRRDMRAED